MLSSPVLEKLRLGDQPKFKANLGYIVSTSLGYRVNTCLERITDNLFKRVTDFVFRYSICALCFRTAIPEIKTGKQDPINVGLEVLGCSLDEQKRSKLKSDGTAFDLADDGGWL